MKGEFDWLRALIDTSDQPVFAFDRELRYTAFNSAHADVMRSLYGVEIALGGRLADYQTVTADRETAQANLERALAGEHVVASAFSGEPGRERYFDIVHDPLTDAAGTVVGVVVHAYDVSETKAAEEEVSTILRTTIDGYYLVDKDGRFLDTNDAYCQMIGHSRDELLRMSVGDIEAIDTQEDIEKRIQLIMETGHDRFETKHRRKDGRVIDIEASVSLLRGDQEKLIVFMRDITERKRADEALAEKTRLAQIFMDALPCVALLLDRSRTVILPNKAAVEAGALPGTQCFSTWGQRADSCPWCLAPAALESGEARHVVVEALGIVWDAHWIPVGPDLYLHYAFDITERKRSEEALRESEGFLRGLFDNMPSGAAIYEVRGDGSRGSDYVIKDFNAASLRIEGKTRKEVVGKSLFDLRPAIDEYGLIPVLHGVWQTGEPALFPTTLYSDEHYTNWYENHVFRLPSGEVVAIYDDVTEHRQAEEALRGSEARYRGYVDNAPYGVFVCDENGRYAEVNQAAADLTGYAREELVQLSIADVLAPESHEWGQQHFARLLRTGRASGEGVFLRKDGTSFPARVDAVRLAAARYFGFIVDISEQQRAAAELEASAAQVKQALTATVAALSATTELRDPYTAGHQRRVAELAGAIAAGLGWDAARIEMVETAGLLHDVGKIIVPAEILAKPGRLSEMEMEIIRQHAAASAALIAGIEFGGPVAAIVNQHHERLDGSGYPQGLRGENILPEARILAVADVVEAMSSHRPYRPALGMEVALAEVREHAGEKHDAEVVTVCGRLVEEQGFQFTP